MPLCAVQARLSGSEDTVTRDEFELAYCDGNVLLLDELRRDWGLAAVECDCGEPFCRGWQATFKVLQ